MPNHCDVHEGACRGLVDLGGKLLPGWGARRAEVPAVEPCSLTPCLPGRTPPSSRSAAGNTDGTPRANTSGSRPLKCLTDVLHHPLLLKPGPDRTTRTRCRRLESALSACIIKRSLDRHSITLVMTQATSEPGSTRSALLRPGLQERRCDHVDLTERIDPSCQALTQFR